MYTLWQYTKKPKILPIIPIRSNRRIYQPKGTSSIYKIQVYFHEQYIIEKQRCLNTIIKNSIKIYEEFNNDKNHKMLVR